MDTSIPHYRFGRTAAEQREYRAALLDAGSHDSGPDPCPPHGLPRPMLDAERLRRLAVVAEAFEWPIATALGIFWYLSGDCDELALGAFEVGRAERAAAQR